MEKDTQGWLKPSKFHILNDLSPSEHDVLKLSSEVVFKF